MNYTPSSDEALEMRSESDVQTDRLENLGYRFTPLPLAFPDNAVRIAYKSFDQQGNVSYGPVTGTTSNSRYQIIIDFINSDISYFRVEFRNTEGGGRKLLNTGTFDRLISICRRDIGVPDYPSYDDKEEWTTFQKANDECSQSVSKDVSVVTLPAYIGVGLRVIADVISVRGGAELSGLPAIAAAADAGYVNGYLVVQTLGINGRSVTAALPLQSELSSSSVQAALIAIGSIKTKMYDEDVHLKQRVVGFYNSIGASESEIAEIARQLNTDQSTIIWHSPCQKIPDDNG
tara:strand:- start:408 stop:1274 length:867 start_codon:yes stop_codon:yes gene_type:complete